MSISWIDASCALLSLPNNRVGNAGDSLSHSLSQSLSLSLIASLLWNIWQDFWYDLNLYNDVCLWLLYFLDSLNFIIKNYILPFKLMYTFCSYVGICENNVFFRNSWSLGGLNFVSVSRAFLCDWLRCHLSCCFCVFVSVRMYWSASSNCHQRSSYKDCNTLHLPMERFSPVRRFSDGAATIQAFKAHLENSSLIKKLKQVCHYFLWKNMLKALVKRWRLLILQHLCFFIFLPINTF